MTEEREARDSETDAHSHGHSYTHARVHMHRYTHTYTRTTEVKEIALLPDESNNWHDQTRSMFLSGFLSLHSSNCTQLVRACSVSDLVCKKIELKLLHMYKSKASIFFSYCPYLRLLPQLFPAPDQTLWAFFSFYRHWHVMFNALSLLNHQSYWFEIRCIW